MAPGAVQATAATFGPGLDFGALRVETGGIWEIAVTRTPTQADPRNAEWIPFEPRNAQLLLAANAFNRYGPGWSYGPGHNQHDEVIEYFREINGRVPNDMEKLDVEHDRGLYQALLKAYQDKIGFKPGEPPPTAPPPVPPLPSPPVHPPIPPVEPPVTPPTPEKPPVVTPPLPPTPPPPAPVHPLSPVDQRAEELWAVALPVVKFLFTALGWGSPGQKAKQLWVLAKPLAEALIEAWRRR